MLKKSESSRVPARRSSKMLQGMLSHVCFPKDAGTRGADGPEPPVEAFLTEVIYAGDGLLEEMQACQTLDMLRHWHRFESGELPPRESLTSTHTVTQRSAPHSTILAEFERLSAQAGSAVILIERHNCCLHFHRPDITSQLVNIYAYEIQAKRAVVLERPDLRGRFPRANVSVSVSFLDPALAMQLADLCEFADPGSVASATRKPTTGGPVDEWEAAVPTYVFDWLLAYLQATNAKEQASDTFSSIVYQPLEKKIRDDVVYSSSGGRPWRRSLRWAAVKAVMHVSLVGELGDEAGQIAYKAVMVATMGLFLERDDASLAQKHVVQLTHDTAMQVAMKIARRVSKMRGLIENATVTVPDSIPVLLTTLDRTVTQYVSLITSLDAKTTSFNPAPVKDLIAPTDTDTSLSLPDLNSDINRIARMNTAPSPLTTPTKSFRVRDLPGQDPLINPDAYAIVTWDGPASAYVCLPRLRRFEDAVFDRVSCQPMKAEADWNSETRLRTMLSYDKLATKVYTEMENVVGLSRCRLCVIAWVVLADVAICKSISVVSEYSLPELASSVVANLLCSSSQERGVLNAVEQYLQMRTLCPAPSSPGPSSAEPPARTALHVATRGALATSSDESLAVRIAGADERMMRMRDTIVAASQAAEDEHRVMVRRQIEARKTLLAERAVTEHSQYEKTTKYGRIKLVCYRYCRACSLDRQLRDLSCSVFERYLPTQPADQLAVVFDMMAPADYRFWRDAIAFLVYGHVREQRSRDLNYLWRQRSCLQRWYWQYPVPSSVQVHLGSARSENLGRRRELGMYATEESFFAPCAMDCRMSTGRSPSDVAFSSVYCVPEVKSPEVTRYGSDSEVDTFKPLSAFVKTCSHTQNEVIAELSHCHPNMSPSQFISFGSLRAGVRLQWCNLLRDVHERVLDLHEICVARLLVYMLWQAGPPCVENRTARSVHVMLCNDLFVRELCVELVDVLKSVKDWSKHWTVLCVLIVANRLRDFFPLSAPVQADITKIREQCRALALGWIITLRAELSDAQGVAKEEDCVSRRRVAADVATFGLISFQHESLAQLEFATPKEAEQFIFFRIAQWEYTTLSAAPCSGFRKFLRSMSLDTVVKVSSSSFDDLGPDATKKAIGDAVKLYYNLPGTHVPAESQGPLCTSRSNGPVCMLLWRRPDESTPITVDIWTGQVHFNGLPKSRLSESITSQPLYKRTFPSALFEVVPLSCEKEHEQTTQIINQDTRSCMSFLPDRHSLRIIEKRDGSPDALYLVDHEFFRRALPLDLVENHSFWLLVSPGSQTNYSVFLRPKVWTDPAFFCDLTECAYRLETVASTLGTPRSRVWRLIRTVDGASLLSYASSCAAVLLGRVSSIEEHQRVHLWFTPSSATVIPATTAAVADLSAGGQQCVTEHITLATVFLPRYNLTFQLLRTLSELPPAATPTLVLASVEHSGWVLDGSQRPSTLRGLDSCLVLAREMGGTTPPQSEVKILVPFGRPQHGSGRVWSIPRDGAVDCIPVFSFKADTVLRILRAQASMAAWLYLALLHGLTSCVTPDPFTGITGTEAALSILQSERCFSSSPYDAQCTDILVWISQMLSPSRSIHGKGTKVAWPVGISPLCAHDGYLPLVAHLRVMSERYAFLYNDNPNGASSTGAVQRSTRRSAVTNPKSSTTSSIENLHYIAYCRYGGFVTARAQVDLLSAPPVDPRAKAAQDQGQSQVLFTDDGKHPGGSSLASSKVGEVTRAVILQKRLASGSLPFDADSLLELLLKSRVRFAPENDCATISMFVRVAEDLSSHFLVAHHQLEVAELLTSRAMLLSALAFRRVDPSLLSWLIALSAMLPIGASGPSPTLLPDDWSEFPAAQPTIASIPLDSIVDKATLQKVVSDSVDQTSTPSSSFSYYYSSNYGIIQRQVQERLDQAVSLMKTVLLESERQLLASIAEVSAADVAAVESGDPLSALDVEPTINRARFLVFQSMHLKQLRRYCDLENYCVRVYQACCSAPVLDESCPPPLSNTPARLIAVRPCTVKLACPPPFDLAAKVSELSQAVRSLLHVDETRVVDERVSQLSRAFEAACGKDTLDPVAKDFAQDLQVPVGSSTAMLGDKALPPAVYELLREHEQVLAAVSKAMWVQLSEAVSSSFGNAGAASLISTGIIKRVCPVEVVSLLTRPFAEESVLCRTDEQPDLGLRAFVTSLLSVEVFVQKLRRCLQHIQTHNYDWALRELEFALRPETQSVPVANGEVFEINRLLFELDNEVAVRPIQELLARCMLSPTEGKPTALQLNMGEGKTSVVLPLVACSIADGARLSRVIVLSAQLKTNFQDLVWRVGGLLRRRVYRLPFSRDIRLELPAATAILSLLKECVHRKGILMVAPEHVLSLQLKYAECCCESSLDSQLVGKLMEIVEYFRQTACDVIDETDAVLHHNFQLIYAMGSRRDPHGGQARWTTMEAALRAVGRVAEQLKGYDSTRVLYTPARQGSFPMIRIMATGSGADDIYKHLCGLLGEDGALFEELHFHRLVGHARSDRARLWRCLITAELPSEDVSWLSEKIDEARPNCAAVGDSAMVLRGLLAYDVLKLVLTKRYRVEYGIDEKQAFRPNPTRMAVPFRAKDSPAERAEFGHVDVAIGLTQLSCYHRGLLDSEIDQVLKTLSSREGGNEIFSQWVQHVGASHLGTELCNINLSDVHTMSGVYPLLSSNTLAINYYLSHVVFPAFAKQFEFKLIASAWDLCPYYRKLPVTGFSGTNDTRHLLPGNMQLGDRRLECLRETNARVCRTVMMERNNRSCKLAFEFTGQDVLKLAHENSCTVLIDAGALMIDLSNKAVVQRWLELQPLGTGAHAAVFFDNDTLSVITKTRPTQVTPLHLTPFAADLQGVLVYIDDMHSRGTDLRIPHGARAAVTLGPGLCKDKLVQACMRMRRLESSHQLCFVIPVEVDLAIRRVAAEAGEVVRDTDTVTNCHVLLWTLVNSVKATQAGFLSWASNGMQHVRTSRAMRPSKSHSRSPSARVKDGCLAPDMVGLETYLADRKSWFIADLVQSWITAEFTRYNRPASYYSDVQTRCTQFAPTVRCFANVLDETQEREIEVHVEPEREREKIPSASALKELCSSDLLKYCHVQSATSEEAVTLIDKFSIPMWHVLLKTALGSRYTAQVKHSAWLSSSLRATQGFAATVEVRDDYFRVYYDDYDRMRSSASKGPKGRGLKGDLHLRPAWWLLTRRDDGGNVCSLVLLSPVEADTLLKHHGESRLCSDVTLAMFVPATRHIRGTRIITTLSVLGPSLEPAESAATSPTTLEQRMFAELFIFSGGLYFPSPTSMVSFCARLQLHPNPLDADSENLREHLDRDCFLAYPSTTGMFDITPLPLVLQLYEVRNHSTEAVAVSHVGKILYDQRKPLLN